MLPPNRFLIVTALGNLLLALPFFISLIHPTSAQFIYDTAFLIFIAEFMTIHSSAFALSTQPPALIKKILLIGVYMAVVGIVALATSNIFLPIYFFVSLLIKFFGKRSEQMFFQVAVSLFALFVALGAGLLSAQALATLFPIPQEIVALKPEGTSGFFADYPQGFLLWGILYYAIIALAPLWLHKKRSPEPFRKG